jgi:ATP-dependent Clp protease ATP-binding subunit ClpC
LIKQLSENPRTLIILDEVDKAPKEVLDIFLPVFDDARLESGKGEILFCPEALFIMMSNYGAEKFGGAREIGFGTVDWKAGNGDDVKRKFAEKYLRPELVARLDDIIVFNSLEEEDLEKICIAQIAELNSSLKEKMHPYFVEIETAAVFLLSKLSHEKGFGARPLLTNIDELIRFPLSEMFHMGELSENSKIIVKTDKPFDELFGLKKTEMKNHITFEIVSNDMGGAK